MVSSRPSVMYEGIFQFVSVINSNYCYIQFDTRRHIIRWEKSLVHKIDLNESTNQRIIRGMVRRQRTADVNSGNSTIPSDDISDNSTEE